MLDYSLLTHWYHDVTWFSKCACACEFVLVCSAHSCICIWEDNHIPRNRTVEKITDISHVHCICICVLRVCNCWRPLYSRLCAWAESTWPAVDTVDRYGQQNAVFATLWAGTTNPVVQQYWQLNCAYKCLSCLDLQIQRFLCWQTYKQSYFIPCACMRDKYF